MCLSNPVKFFKFIEEVKRRFRTTKIMAESLAQVLIRNAGASFTLREVIRPQPISLVAAQQPLQLSSNLSVILDAESKDSTLCHRRADTFLNESKDPTANLPELHRTAPAPTTAELKLPKIETILELGKRKRRERKY